MKDKLNLFEYENQLLNQQGREPAYTLANTPSIYYFSAMDVHLQSKYRTIQESSGIMFNSCCSLI